MAENSGGGGLWSKVGAGLLVAFFIGLFLAPETVSSRFFRALNSLVDNSGGWGDNPKVGLVIFVVLLVWLFTRLMRSI